MRTKQKILEEHVREMNMGNERRGGDALIEILCDIRDSILEINENLAEELRRKR